MARRKIWRQLTEIGKYRRLRQILNENSSFGNVDIAIYIEILLSEYGENRKEDELDYIASRLKNLGYKLRWYDLLD